MPNLYGMPDGFLKRGERLKDGVWRDQVGVGVRQARKRLRYSQTDLAIRAGVDPGAISDIELGKTDPTISMMATLADVLETSVDELLGRPASVIQPDVSPKSVSFRLESLEEQADEMVEVAERTDRLDAVLDVLLSAGELPESLRDRLRTAREPG